MDDLIYFSSYDFLDLLLLWSSDFTVSIVPLISLMKANHFFIFCEMFLIFFQFLSVKLFTACCQKASLLLFNGSVGLNNIKSIGITLKKTLYGVFCQRYFI